MEKQVSLKWLLVVFAIVILVTTLGCEDEYAGIVEVGKSYPNTPMKCENCTENPWIWWDTSKAERKLYGPNDGDNYSWTYTEPGVYETKCACLPDHEWENPKNVAAITVNIDALIYGETGRKIEDIVGDTITVISSGYVKFEVQILPVQVDPDDLYYEWSITKGTLDDPASGDGDDLKTIKWDAPDTAETGIILTLVVKSKSGGDDKKICTKTSAINVVRPRVVRIKFVDHDGNNEYPVYDTARDFQTDPEWDITTIAPGPYNRPVCYKKKTRVKVEADMAASTDPTDNDLDLSVATPIRIYTTAKFGTTESRPFRHSFPVGPSYATLDVNDWEPTDYSDLHFTLNAVMPDVVAEYEDFVLEWTYKVYQKSETWVTAYKAGAEEYSEQTTHLETVTGRGNAYTCGFYLVYDVPSTPMQEPWKEILDYGCGYVNGAAATPQVVMTAVTADLRGACIGYDPGHVAYLAGGQAQRYALNAMLNNGWTAQNQNCLEMAHLLDIIGRALGAHSATSYCWYDSKTLARYPAGCGGPPPAPPCEDNLNDVLPMSSATWTAYSFRYHAFVSYSTLASTGNLWDAALQLDNDCDPSGAPHTALPVQNLTRDTYKSKLLQGAWFVSDPQTYNLSDGDTLLFQTESSPPNQLATFNTADFTDISNATAAEVAAVINEDSTQGTASVCGTSVKLQSNQGPAAGTLQVTGGVAQTELGFPGNLRHAIGWADRWSGSTQLE